MSSANFLKASIMFIAPLILTACKSPDFVKIKPDFSQIKNVPTSILNIGKIFGDSKNEDILNSKVDNPLPLNDI